MVHIMSQKKNIHIYFVMQRLTFSNHAIITEVKANCYDCACNHTMPTASWSKGFHSTLSGKCARTLDLKVLRKGLCSKFSPESETKTEK